jgi:Peptidylarginine deiminase and related enzymes
MKRILFFVAALVFSGFLRSFAQETPKPDWRKLHYLSEEEMNTPIQRDLNFTETDPPTGEVRFVGEFEPMQAVMVRYPLGIPVSTVAELAEDCQVITIVTSSYQNQAMNTYQSAGVNMNNCVFVNANTDTYWIRDYGPWYIFNGTEPAIVDNVYNRPRPNDNLIPVVMASYWDIDLFGMNLIHTGGNMMEDGRGHGVSDDLVIQENNDDETNVRNKMRDYLGIDPYHITIDPQGEYIAHVDCWGKYLAPDKILIARVPESNPHYADYESVATYFATTNCCWGYPYTVYRVEEPGGYTLAPYTNSLIVNNKVLVPMGDIDSYNQAAIAVYQEAMPGYEIIGIENNDYSIGWENTDALHCRTRGVMDFNMLFVDHRNVIHGEQAWQDSIAIVSKFIAYSGQDLVQDSLLVYYSIDGGAYQAAHMTATGNANEYVGYIKGYQSGSEIDYYVFGKDESGHRYSQPVFEALDPHHFIMEEHEMLTMSEDTLWYENGYIDNLLTITNGTNSAVTITNIPTTSEDIHVYYQGEEFSSALPFVLQPGQNLSVNITLGSRRLQNRSYAIEGANVISSLGTQHVTLMINDEVWNSGLHLSPEQGLSFEPNESLTKEFIITNMNHEGDITVNDIAEWGSTYFTIEPSEILPKVLAPQETLTVTVTLTNPFGKDYVNASIRILNDDSPAQIEYPVSINQDILSVAQNNGTDCQIYPNPVNDQFVVKGENIEEIRIYNLIGQVVLETKACSDMNRIDASEWNEGIYMISIMNETGKISTKKFIVKK